MVRYDRLPRRLYVISSFSVILFLAILTKAEVKKAQETTMASTELSSGKGSTFVKTANEIESIPLEDRTPETSNGSFSLLSFEETGVDFQISIDGEHPLRKLYEIAFAGAGVCIGDYDKDGKPDIFLSHHTEPNRLYRQVSAFRFEDVTKSAGIGGQEAWSAGASFVDINNDGFLDLYVCNFNKPNSLFVNNGNGTFTEKAKEYGLDYKGASVMAAFADYDRDGNLDMYLLTSRLQAKTGENEPFQIQYERGPGGRKRPRADPRFRDRFDFIEKPNGRTMKIKTGQRDILFRNNGNQTFSPIHSFLRENPSKASKGDDNHMGDGCGLVGF